MTSRHGPQPGQQQQQPTRQRQVSSRPNELSSDQARMTGPQFQPSRTTAIPLSASPLGGPPLQRRGTNQVVPFPNPHPVTTTQQRQQTVAAIQQPPLRRKSPFFASQITPITPPPPAASSVAAARTGGGSRLGSHQTKRFADERTQAVRAPVEVDPEDSIETRWSSDGSTPTPTASSVHAASLRRREEAKSMKPVTLSMPEQPAWRKSELVTSPSVRQIQKKSGSSVPRSEPQTTFLAQADTKGKGVAAQKQSEASQSFRMPGGQEVLTIRKDFENMKRISRPPSSSIDRPSAAQGGMLTVPPQDPENVRIASPLSASMPLPKAPVVQAAAQFEQQRPPSSEAATSALQEFEPHRITPVQEENEQQPPPPTPPSVPAQTTSQAPRRHSHASSILRRSSFDSTSTALDTPQLGGDDGTPAFFEMVRGGNPTDAAAMYAVASATQARRGVVSGPVEPLSDVTEQNEPRSGGVSTHERQGTPRSQNLSAHVDQLHRFIYNTAGSGSAARSAAAASGGLPYAPNTLNAMRRPMTANSARQRPGTGQTRVSFEAAPPTRSKRRLGSAGSDGANRLRIFGSNKDMLRIFQSNDSPTTGSRTKDARHTHDKPACRQCFRAGFDCAIQLQTGHGTGARKALQEFVTAGGLESQSGVEDFYEGSVWAAASQMGSTQHATTVAAEARRYPPVTGQNFVDRLGEVAFGESALSRPVTRGAVQSMLEERGDALARRQHSKTVEDFLAELQRLQKEQEIEDALQPTHEQSDGVNDSQGTMTQSRPRSSRRASAAARSGDVVEGDGEAVEGVGGAAGDDGEGDDLPFLADRWTLKRKMLQLTICALWIFCVQCVGAGYDASLPAIAAGTEAEMLFLQVGQFAFLAGQGGGLLLGPSLASFGRHRSAPLLVTLFTAVSVVFGFVHLGVVLVVLRGTLGCLAGAFEGLTLAMILDVSTTHVQRLSLFVYVVTFVMAAQGAAPWIAHVVLRVGSWPWLYWLAAIFGVCYVVLFAFVARETDAFAIYRAQVRRLRLHSDSVWTPEPRRPAPTVKLFLAQHVLRPYVVLSRHAVVAVSSVVLIVVLGATVAVLGPYAITLLVSHRMESWKASLLISVCVGVGLCVGACAMLFLARSEQHGRGGGELGGDKAERTRVLYMDESGLIDAQRPAFDAEAIVARIVAAGFIACVVGLFTLALTATLTSWIFSAVSLCIVVAGAMMIVTGLLHYLSQAYFPAHRTTLREVLAPTEQEHRGDDGDAAAQEKEATDDESIPDDHSLMSGADETGTRLHSRWALSAVSIALALALLVGGAMTIVGQIASARIGFTLFAAIVASSVLGVAGLALCVLLRMGKRMRHQAFVHVAQTEERHMAKTAALASATTSTVEQAGAHEQSRLRRLRFMFHARERRHDIEGGNGGAPRSHPRRWPWRRRSSASPASLPPRMSISAPFDVQHVASGEAELLTGAAAAVAQRRQTLVGDAADEWRTMAAPKVEPTTLTPVVPVAAQSPRAVGMASERQSSFAPDRLVKTGHVPQQHKQSAQDVHFRRRPRASPPPPNMPAAPAPVAVAAATRPRPLPYAPQRQPSTIRMVQQRRSTSDDRHAAEDDDDDDELGTINGQRAAQQAQLIWSFSRPHARQPSMGGDGVRIVAARPPQ